jgi:FtsH-binding integral membrane protein
MSLPVAVRVLRRRPPVFAAWASLALAGAMSISVAANPPSTQQGQFFAFTALVGAGVACSVIVMTGRQFRACVVLPLGLVAAAQGLLMALQIITEQPIGLRVIWPDSQLRVIDGILRPQGTFIHVFEPALLATVAIAAIALTAPTTGHRRMWQGLAGLASVPIALSYSRAGALAALCVLGSLFVAHRRGTRGALPMAAAMAIALVVAGLLVAPGWLTKLDQTTGDSVDDLSMGRVTLARQGLVMIRDHPIVGVGTAKYIPTLRAEYETERGRVVAPHNFAILLTAEVGIPLGLLVIALSVATGVQAVRAGPLPAGAYLAMVPWWLFDVLYYERMYGILVFGVWWGVVGHGTEIRHRSLATRSS